MKWFAICMPPCVHVVHVGFTTGLLEPETLGKRQKTLGKLFVECNTRRIALAINSADKANFASVIYRALGKVFAVCCLALGEKKRS